MTISGTVTISGLVTDIGGFLVRACAGGSRYATACAFTLLAGLQPARQTRIIGWTTRRVG
jgi:hypothetical protein